MIEPRMESSERILPAVETTDGGATTEGRMAERDVVRVAAVGDLHYGRTSQGTLQSLFAAVNARADLLLLAGDLTDYGTPEEAHNLAHELTTSIRVPIVGILGNHDFESGHADEVRDNFCASGVSMLDGETFEMGGIGIAGVKGFAGGFGRGTLGYWGEPAIKRFVQEAIDEALKLTQNERSCHGGQSSARDRALDGKPPDHPVIFLLRVSNRQPGVNLE
jgi:predicted MPP superfamily phosphohydrolase